MSCTDPHKKHFRQKNRQCKGPVAGMSLVCFQGSREACVAEGECAVEEGMREVRRAAGISQCEDFGFLFLGVYLWASLVAQTVKKICLHAGDPDSIPGSGRSPEVGNGTPLQYSCLENFMGRGA